MAHAKAQSLLETVQRRGLIRIAARWDVTPEQYLDPDTSEPAGVVGKIGRLLAADLGVKPEFVVLAWDDHVPALIEDRVDILLKHTNMPQRAFLVDFARGTLERYTGHIVVRRDHQLSGESDLDDADRLLAVTSGSYQETQARTRYPRARVELYQSSHQGMEAVFRGEADACLADAWIPNFLLLRPECQIMVDDQGAPIVTSIDYAHPCIRKGDQGFLNWLDNWMDFHAVQGTFERAIADAYREHEAKFERIMALYFQVDDAAVG
jgi:ABC-type amino acid transport substrate-binding protein